MSYFEHQKKFKTGVSFDFLEQNFSYFLNVFKENSNFVQRWREQGVAQINDVRINEIQEFLTVSHNLIACIYQNLLKVSMKFWIFKPDIDEYVCTNSGYIMITRNR